MSRVILVIMVNMVWLNFAFGEQVTPSQLLEKYKANRGVLERHITQSEQLVEVRDTAYGDNPKWIRQIYQFRTDGNRVDLTINRCSQLDKPDANGLPENLSEKRVIWDGERYIEYNPLIPPGKKRVYFSTKEQKKNRFLSLAYGGSSLDGIFFGDLQPVEAILGRASDIMARSRMENVNGSDCYVIDANTPNGKYTLWIDPEHGYNIAKARVHKIGDDILGGKPISQHFVSEAKKRARFRGIKTKEREEFFFSLDIVEFQKISDVWLPIEASIQITTKYVDGRVITAKRHHKRTHINPNPDFELVHAFVPDIPDGTRVYVDESPGVRYVWQDGKIVPDVDAPTFEEIDKTVEELKTKEGKASR